MSPVLPWTFVVHFRLNSLIFQGFLLSFSSKQQHKLMGERGREGMERSILFLFRFCLSLQAHLLAPPLHPSAAPFSPRTHWVLVLPNYLQLLEWASLSARQSPSAQRAFPFHPRPIWATSTLHLSLSSEYTSSPLGCTLCPFRILELGLLCYLGILCIPLS